MALNLDTTFKLKAKVEGAKTVDNFKKQLRGLDTSSKLSKVQLGRMNIEINRMARAAGNTTKGLREHIRALTLLKDRTEVGGKAYKRLGTQIDNLKGKLKGFDGQAVSSSQKLAGLVATLGVGRALRGVIGGAARYEEEVKKTAAIEGGGANFAQIDESIRQTAQIAAGTPQEVAELATSLARAGFDADQISGSLNGIVLGAEATSTAFNEMGSIVANNINAFGLEISDTNALVDILVASANNANQTVSDLGESLKYAAPVAKTFGLTVNDTAATVGLLAQAGIKGSEAGTALRSGLSRLQIAATGAQGRLLGVSRGSQMLAKGFKALSSDILDANGNLKPMDEVLIALKRDFKGVTDAGQKAEISKAIFGQEQGPKFLALLGRTEEDIRSMFEAVRNSADVAQRTRKAMASFGLTTKILGGNFQVVTNQIGAAFIAVLHPLAKLLNSLLTVASKLPTPIKGIASAFAAAGIAAGSFIAVTATLNALQVGAALQPLIVSLKSLTLGFLGAVKASLLFLATNPFGWAIIAGASITLLLVKFKGFREYILNLPTPIKAVGTAIAALIASLTTLKVLMSIGFLKTFAVALKGVAVAFLGAAKAALIFLAANPLTLIPIFIAAFTIIIVKSKKFRDYIVRIVGEIVEFFTVTIPNKFNEFIGAVVTIVNNFLKIFNGLREKIKEIITGVIGNIDKFIVNILKQLSKIPVAGKVFEQYLRAYQGTKELTLDLKDKATEKIENLTNKIKDGISIPINNIQEFGDDFKKEISKIFAEGGALNPDQLLLLLQNFVKDTKNVITNIGSNIIGGGNGQGNGEGGNNNTENQFGIVAGIKDYFESIKSGAEEVKSAVSKAFQNMENAIVQFVMTGKLNFAEFTRSIIADMTRIIVRQALLKPLLGGIFGFKMGGVVQSASNPTEITMDSFNALGNVYDKNGLTKFAKGGIIDEPTYFAKGGIIDEPTYFAYGGSGKLGLMGEAGSEAIMPLKRGKDGKLGVISQGGAVNNVTVNVDASGSSVEGNNGESEQLGIAISQAIQAELLEQQRPGGLLYN